MPLSIKIYPWDALKLQEHPWVNKNLDWLLNSYCPSLCITSFHRWPIVKKLFGTFCFWDSAIKCLSSASTRHVQTIYANNLKGSVLREDFQNCQNPKLLGQSLLQEQWHGKPHMNPFVVVFGVLDVQPTKAPWQIHADTTNHHKPHLNYTVGSRPCQNCTAVSRSIWIEEGLHCSDMWPRPRALSVGRLLQNTKLAHCYCNEPEGSWESDIIDPSCPETNSAKCFVPQGHSDGQCNSLTHCDTTVCRTLRRCLFLGRGSAISYVWNAATSRCHFKTCTNDWRKQPQGLSFAGRFSKLPESKASRPEPASRTMTWKAPYEPICGCLWGLGCSTNKGAMADTCRYHKPSQTTSQLHRWLKTLPELHSCQLQHLDWRGLALQRHVAATQSLVCR